MGRTKIELKYADQVFSKLKIDQEVKSTAILRRIPYATIASVHAMMGLSNALSTLLIASTIGHSEFGAYIACTTLVSSTLLINRGMQAAIAELEIRKAETQDRQLSISNKLKNIRFLKRFIVGESLLWAFASFTFARLFDLPLLMLLTLTILVGPQVLTSLITAVHQSQENFYRWNLSILISTIVRLPLTFLVALIDGNKFAYLLILPMSPLTMILLTPRNSWPDWGNLGSLTLKSVLLPGTFLQLVTLLFQLPLIGLKRGPFNGDSSAGLLLFILGMSSSIGAAYGSSRFRRLLVRQSQITKRKKIARSMIYVFPLALGYLFYLTFNHVLLNLLGSPKNTFSISSLQHLLIFGAYIPWTLCLAVTEERLSQVRARAVTSVLALFIVISVVNLQSSMGVTTTFLIHAFTGVLSLFLFVNILKPSK